MYECGKGDEAEVAALLQDLVRVLTLTEQQLKLLRRIKGQLRKLGDHAPLHVPTLEEAVGGLFAHGQAEKVAHMTPEQAADFICRSRLGKSP